MVKDEIRANIPLSLLQNKMLKEISSIEDRSLRSTIQMAIKEYLVNWQKRNVELS